MGPNIRQANLTRTGEILFISDYVDDMVHMATVMKAHGAKPELECYLESPLDNESIQCKRLAVSFDSQQFEGAFQFHFTMANAIIS